jgi:hypothetical protein
MSRPVDPQRLHGMEQTARDIGRIIGDAINQAGTGMGFMLLLFSFEGPEATYISNGARDDMVKALRELLERFEDGTADELSRPKGRG